MRVSRATFAKLSGAKAPKRSKVKPPRLGSALEREFERLYYARSGTFVEGAGILYPLTPQYRFDPTRRWTADFAIPAEKILVELEGGIYSNGRHVRGKGYEQDLHKYNCATLQGWRVLRFSAGMVNSGVAVRALEALLCNDTEAVMALSLTKIS